MAKKVGLLPSTFRAFGGAGGAARSGGNKSSPPSIIGRAIAGHPNWSGQPSSVRPGVGQAGSALLGNAGQQSTQSAPAPTPPAQAPAPPPPVAPFATEAQQLAWDAYVQRYNTSVGALNQRLNDAIFNTNNQLQTAQHTHDTGYDMTNQSLAARGLFQSSIRQGELNDLDAALVMRQNTLNSALNSMRIQIGGQITNLNTDYNTQAYNFYQEEVGNAAAITPNVSAGTPPAPAPAAAPAPAQSNPNTGVGQAGSALLGGASALTGGGVGQAGSAILGPRQPGGLAAGLSHIGSALGQAKPPGNRSAKPPGAGSAGSTLMAMHPNNFGNAMHIGAPA